MAPEMSSPFGSLKQIEAGALSVGYAEAGPDDGPAVVLLHGWPYDIHSFAEVTPLLAAAGYRVIVPWLRGYGSTRFLSEATPRTGQQSALAVDTIALMDALGLSDAVIGGFDWGARTANVIAALWPSRCRALVSVSGYLIGNQRPARIRCLRQRSCPGGTSSTSLPTAAGPVMTGTVVSSPGSFGTPPHRSGTSTRRCSTRPPRPSTTPITSTS